MVRFLDTNILIRYLTGDDPDKASLALALLDRVAEGTDAGRGDRRGLQLGSGV